MLQSGTLFHERMPVVNLPVQVAAVIRHAADLPVACSLSGGVGMLDIDAKNFEGHNYKAPGKCVHPGKQYWCFCNKALKKYECCDLGKHCKDDGTGKCICY